MNTRLEYPSAKSEHGIPYRRYEREFRECSESAIFFGVSNPNSWERMEDGM